MFSSQYIQMDMGNCIHVSGFAHEKVDCFNETAVRVKKNHGRGRHCNDAQQTVFGLAGALYAGGIFR